MSDAELRLRERRWGESGAPNDEAAYLRRLLQADELTEEQVFLAARCGHIAAQLLIDNTIEIGCRHELARTLSTYGNSALLVGSLSAGIATLDIAEQALFMNENAPRRGLDYAVICLLAPSDTSRLKARCIRRSIYNLWWPQELRAKSTYALRSIEEILIIAQLSIAERASPDSCENAIWHAREAICMNQGGSGDQIEQELIQEAKVRISNWVLGREQFFTLPKRVSGKQRPPKPKTLWETIKGILRPDRV